jgi:hypothetical protein
VLSQHFSDTVLAAPAERLTSRVCSHDDLTMDLFVRLGLGSNYLGSYGVLWVHIFSSHVPPSADIPSAEHIIKYNAPSEKDKGSNHLGENAPPTTFP